METKNNQKLFSVSITHNLKIRELSDGNRVMETKLSFAKQPFCYRSHHFWVMSYGNRELSYQKRQFNQKPVWVSFFHYSISVTQFPSLIAHHLFFHTHLATSLLFSSLNFFTLFMGPTPVNWYSFFFFFSIPNSPKLILLKKKKKKTERPTQEKKRKEKKKKHKQPTPTQKKKKVKRWSKVADVGPLCVFNYNIAIMLWVMKIKNWIMKIGNPNGPLLTYAIRAYVNKTN